MGISLKRGLTRLNDLHIELWCKAFAEGMWILERVFARQIGDASNC